MKDPNSIEQLWLNCLQESIEGSLGVSCQVRTAAAPASFAEALWWEEKFSLAPSAFLWAGAGKETWSHLGHLALQAAGVHDGDDATRRETYLEVVRQALACLAERISLRCGRPVTCERGREGQPGSGVEVMTLAVTAGNHPELTLHAALDPSLLEATTTIDTPGEEARSADVPAVIETAQPGGGGVYDLLLDVELPICISFGQAILQLKEVLKLTSGSIVELNRGVSEPVEVIVNNCVVARGDVVVVDGNYGVRIREIVSRQERLRTLD